MHRIAALKDNQDACAVTMHGYTPPLDDIGHFKLQEDGSLVRTNVKK